MRVFVYILGILVGVLYAYGVRNTRQIMVIILFTWCLCYRQKSIFFTCYFMAKVTGPI